MKVHKTPPTPAGMATIINVLSKHKALKKKVGFTSKQHEQHAAHNKRIEEIDRKAGIGRFDPKRHN